MMMLWFLLGAAVGYGIVGLVIGVWCFSAIAAAEKQRTGRASVRGWPVAAVITVIWPVMLLSWVTERE